MKALSDEQIAQAAVLASEELLYASTNAASAEYRKALVRAYIKRGLEEVSK